MIEPCRLRRRARFSWAGGSVLRALVAFCALAIAACAGRQPSPVSREKVEQVVTHRVESGETWGTIARDFYGDEGRAAELARDNGMDPGASLGAGSAVRVFLTARDVKRVKDRLDAARAYNEGLDLAGGGNFAAATAKFEEALALDPSLNDASFNLAVSYEKLGFHDKAIPILRRLVAAAPGSSTYRYALGASLFAAGDLGGAASAFAEVLARDPADRKSLFSLAVVLEKRGETEEATRRFQEYLAVDPQGEWAEAARSHLEKLLKAKGGAR